MLRRNRGKYPSQNFNTETFAEDREVMSEAQKFFEEDCKDCPSVEVGYGGNYSRDILRKISDKLWILKDVFAEYDVDFVEITIVSPEEARGLIQRSVDKKRAEIKKLVEENQAALGLLRKMKK